MLTVYTSTYRYSGPDRFNVAAYGGNSAFSPDRDLLYGQYDNLEYTRRYLALLERSQAENPREWSELLDRDRVVLVEFNNPEMFCHRRILAAVLMDLGATYGGELNADVSDSRQQCG